jgi:hypothetical protein
VTGIRRRNAVALTALALSMAACEPTPALRQQSTFLALANHPAGRVRGPYCLRNGPREWRHGFRAPTWCAAYYDDGDAQWVRRADGTVVRAGRGWLLAAEDSIRWGVLRDSVTAAITALASGAAPCVTDQPFGNGGRLTAWELPNYDATIIRFERVPGGFPEYHLQAGVVLGHRVCRASREPAA